MGFPSGSVIENPTTNMGDTGLIFGLERAPGEGNGNLLQYSCLGIPWTEEPGGLNTVGSQKSQTWFTFCLKVSMTSYHLSDFTSFWFDFYMHIIFTFLILRKLICWKAHCNTDKNHKLEVFYNNR